MSTSPISESVAPEDTGPFGWFRSLGAEGRRAFAGAFGGFALDSYDFWVLPLGLVAIAESLQITTAEAGVLTTVTLVLSAVGGVGTGILIDRIGRVRTLMITVITYAVFTVLCGFAQNFETLLVFRALQGLGFGGEWAAGAILVAEYCSPRYRGRTVGFIQSSWAVGWALSVVVATVVFSLADPHTAWRWLFWTGALPALLVIYIRRRVVDAPIAAQRPDRHRGSIAAIFGRRLGWTTLCAALLATGVQGGYYTLAAWLPTYLKTQRHLAVLDTGAYLVVHISGAFIGYLTGSYLTDLLGRKRTFVLFAALSAGLILGYTHIPAEANTAVMIWASRWVSAPQRSSVDSGRSSPSCTRPRNAEPGWDSPTTPAGVSGGCSPLWSASSPPAGAWAARWCSGPSRTASPCWPCSVCPKPAGTNSAEPRLWS